MKACREVLGLVLRVRLMIDSKEAATKSKITGAVRIAEETVITYSHKAVWENME